MSTSQAKRTQLFRNLVKSIKRSNEKFEKADQAGKILMVAKDALALLDLRRIIAEKGTYVRLPEVASIGEEINTSLQPDNKEEEKVSLQNILQMPEVPGCDVCAIGAGMVACTLRLNQVETEKGYLLGGTELSFWPYPQGQGETTNSRRGTGTQMSDQARTVFGLYLLRCMEEAFECGDHGYHKLSSPNGRLRAIYQNLVDHQGKRFTRYKSKTEVYVVQA